MQATPRVCRTMPMDLTSRAAPTPAAPQILDDAHQGHVKDGYHLTGFPSRAARSLTRGDVVLLQQRRMCC